ncbi:MAG: YtxH-like protein [Gemmatimonadetes bacterium]|nr:YtxH-like protein [Gemmatimonadota bacterium]
MRERGREVVYVERGGDVSAKWFLWGALAGAAVALLYAPATGEQTRRGVQRRLRKLRAMAEEKMDELTEHLGERRQRVEDWLEDAEEALELDDEGIEEEEEEGAPVTPRAELEERLARARSRRRGVADASEEQGA